MRTTAIIGTGPTAIYTLLELVSSDVPQNVMLFEAQSEAGAGSPYQLAFNDKAMLSNIASIELPPVLETLVDWLNRQSDHELARLNILRDLIDDRAFFPRVVLGEFYRAQFAGLVSHARARGHVINVKTASRVVDISPQKQDIRLDVMESDEIQHFSFDSVVMATGHTWPEETEIKPGYFTSPWPASNLHSIGNCPVGIRGTSLSAIDALVAVASDHGSFLLDPTGILQYQPKTGSENFHVTMMSRKGLLPEADFYYPLPYEPLKVFTEAAVRQLLENEANHLLDAVFRLFQEELVNSDPEYAAKIGLASLTVESFADAYFAERDASEPFVWAARNLAEAKSNESIQRVVSWRYTILRAHEIIALAVPFLNSEDLKRFHKHLKAVFADDYATVPHKSIERVLAMRRAGKLGILKLGDSYKLDVNTPASGAVLYLEKDTIIFPALIEATGQKGLSAADIPFPSLHNLEIIRPATSTASAVLHMSPMDQEWVETGGVELDAAFRPRIAVPLCKNLYCLSLPFLLHKYPFVQGLTSSYELGRIVGRNILKEVNELVDA